MVTANYPVGMAFPDKHLSDDEEIVEQFRPHWKVLVGSILLFDAIIVIGILIGVFTGIAAWIPILIAFGIGIVVMARPIVEWLFTLYVITTERVIVRSGWLSRSGKEIPLEVINDVAFDQTVGERFFRSGDLLIESAGEFGQSRYSDIPHPERVQALIYQQREDRMAQLNTGRSAADDLAKLAELHRQGSLTDEEFSAKKRQLLDEI